MRSSRIRDVQIFRCQMIPKMPALPKHRDSQDLIAESQVVGCGGLHHDPSAHGIIDRQGPQKRILEPRSVDVHWQKWGQQIGANKLGPTTWGIISEIILINKLRDWKPSNHSNTLGEMGLQHIQQAVGPLCRSEMCYSTWGSTD